MSVSVININLYHCLTEKSIRSFFIFESKHFASSKYLNCCTDKCSQRPNGLPIAESIVKSNVSQKSEWTQINLKLDTWLLRVKVAVCLCMHDIFIKLMVLAKPTKSFSQTKFTSLQTSIYNTLQSNFSPRN